MVVSVGQSCVTVSNAVMVTKFVTNAVVTVTVGHMLSSHLVGVELGYEVAYCLYEHVYRCRSKKLGHTRTVMQLQALDIRCGPHVATGDAAGLTLLKNQLVHPLLLPV